MTMRNTSKAKYISALIVASMISNVACAKPKCSGEDSCNTTAINLYVGPETVTPGQEVFVMVELETSTGESAPDGQSVTLAYTQNKENHLLFGSSENGIVEFTLNAGNRSEQVNFSASTNNLRSKSSKILISSGLVSSFGTDTRRGKLPQSLQVETDIISDIYGNRIEDGTLAELITRSESRLQNVQSSYVSNGRASFTWNCPASITQSLELEVQIKQASTRLNIPSEQCAQRGQE